VNEADTLSPTDQKLVKAAAITYQKTGLTIASHTGTWRTAVQEVRILQEMGLNPSEFVWVHAKMNRILKIIKLQQKWVFGLAWSESAGQLTPMWIA